MEDPVIARRAIRKFMSLPVTQEEIKKLIAAFQAAPCGMHQASVMQASVIVDPALRAEVESKTNNSCYGAPLLFVISTKKGNNFGERNASVAAENVMIEATELGLGSVYIMSGASQLNSYPDLKEKLGITTGFDATVIVCVGKAADQPKLEDRSQRYQVVIK
ncbi:MULTISPECIES: nitroreductase family protein [Lactobacillus]|uniref:Nitroreductase family protein n=1 Tax=Lactobacillus xujianguonis TaxID=2495899 RepID=A0A437SW58_9LACO|nr:MULTISPECIES: nitroreductase family protein [Lactobacillus]RVU71132.1 nitroreductase family protein [Lactobacillus xujianguonis]RVU77479.1 nitroreductase family protein [Lactobacillus xujianguonis]